MNVEQAKQWLLDYARSVNDEVLEYNVENMSNQNQIWREYARRRAAQEGVTLVQGWVTKEAETVEEVRAARLTEKLFGFARIGREGIVYQPSWLDCNDEGVLYTYYIAEPAERILERYGKMVEIAENLTEQEKETLRKLI